MPTPSRRFAAIAAFSAALFVAGCGGGTGSVSGKVASKSKGKVVTGTVMFQGAGGVAKHGMIKDDGSYQIDDIPAGSYKVTVSSPDPSKFVARGDPNEGGRAMPGKDQPRGAKTAPAAATAGWFPIADKYGDPTQSGLTAEVKRGATTHNIDLD